MIVGKSLSEGPPEAPPAPSMPPVVSPIKNPSNHVFKKRRKVQERLFLRPLTSGLGAVTPIGGPEDSTATDEDAVRKPSRRASAKDSLGANSPTKASRATLRKRQLQCSVSEPTLRPMSRASTPHAFNDAVHPPPGTHVAALAESLSSAFVQHHFSSSDAQDTAAEGRPLVLDPDIQAYCQRGPVASVCRDLGTFWLTNMLRTYDIPRSSPVDCAGVETQLQTVIAHATQHFQSSDAAFIQQLMDAVAANVLEYCSSSQDFMHTVAGHYRELLTRLPFLLDERERKLEVAARTIASLESTICDLRALQSSAQDETATAKHECQRAEAAHRAIEVRLQDMAVVVDGAVAAELAQTKALRESQLQAQEQQYTYEMRINELQIEAQDLTSSVQDLNAVIESKDAALAMYAHVQNDRDTARAHIAELMEQLTTLSATHKELVVRHEDTMRTQQVLLFRLSVADATSDDPPIGSKPSLESSKSSQSVSDVDETLHALRLKVTEYEHQSVLAHAESARKENRVRELEFLLEDRRQQLQAAAAARSELQRQHNVLLDQLQALPGPYEATIERCRADMASLQADKADLLVDYGRLIAERDAAKAQASLDRAKAARYEVGLGNMMPRFRALQTEYTRSVLTTRAELQAMQTLLFATSLEVDSRARAMAANEAALEARMRALISSAVGRDPAVVFVLQMLHTKLQALRTLLTDLRKEATSTIQSLVSTHTKELVALRQRVKKAQARLYAKPPVLTKSKSRPIVETVNGATQTEAVEPPETTSTNDVSSALDELLRPVVASTQAKLQHVMMRVERQKQLLLQAYEREADLRNQLRACAPPDNDTSLYDMLHANLDALAETLAAEPYIYTDSTHRQYETTASTRMEDSSDMAANELKEARVRELTQKAYFYTYRAISPTEQEKKNASDAAVDTAPVGAFETSSRTLHTTAAQDAVHLLPALAQATATSMNAPTTMKDTLWSDDDSVTAQPPSTPTTASAVEGQLSANGSFVHLADDVRARLSPSTLSACQRGLADDRLTVHEAASVVLLGDPARETLQHLHPPSAVTPETHVHDLTPWQPATRLRDAVPTRLLQFLGWDLHFDVGSLGRSLHGRPWLLKHMRSIYHDKYIAECLEHTTLHVVLPLPEFLMRWATVQYGVEDLVAKHCEDILRAVNAYQHTSIEIALFASFVSEAFGKSDLSVFLHARQLIIDSIGDWTAAESSDDNTRTTAVHLPLSTAREILTQVFACMLPRHRERAIKSLEKHLPVPSPPRHSTTPQPPAHDVITAVSATSTVPAWCVTAPECVAPPLDAFPAGHVLKAPTPRLHIDVLPLEPSSPQEQAVDIQVFLLYLVLEFRAERRRFYALLQRHVLATKAREMEKDAFLHVLSSSTGWTDAVCCLVFAEAAAESSQCTRTSYGGVAVDAEHLMTVALRYYATLFSLARFPPTSPLTSQGLVAPAPMYRDRSKRLHALD
ncbi:hypothetical protein SPRG_06274 [Saprolegnia parasitica CBS 223.65]|uniref:Uncharacterized protein n=1 Tax=Saprolegnia parasitica (strain CBS 223.65) TaxID=695850 RepID=A0A067CGF3_SAPPC|nr:hypothetical protein SPRG_06274 [Saprolegnia parasitica CBS 223.65]KDO28225.1 hypothetical protein SPRG_06274 [Saprolegnia parasitica CBS 223.65]|eukprot:XP_012201050.1 hypothetical protein SPRG_06274 [Saprolegnia parasitica CBS 223.65]